MPLGSAMTADGQRPDKEDKKPSASTLQALDWINFSLAFVQLGVGPFLAVYQEVGLALTVGAIAGIATQSLAGWLADSSKAKRALIASGIALVAIGSLSIALFPSFMNVIATQIIIGGSLTIFVPAVCALSRGLVCLEQFDARQGRNQSFMSAGNIVAAIFAGLITYSLSNRTIFFLVCIAAIPALTMLPRINADEIDHDRARGANHGSPSVGGLLDILMEGRLVIFMLSAVLLSFANAAMLPLIGEVVATSAGGKAMMFMSACVITAQTIMAMLAYWVGKMAHIWGRRPLLLIAFAMLPVRGLMYAMTRDLELLVILEILDGITSSIFAVVSVLVISDLTRGTGRFNLILGIMATATSIGAALSQVTAGYVAHHYGVNQGFFFLTFVAAGAFAVLALFMPETTQGSIQRQH